MNIFGVYCGLENENEYFDVKPDEFEVIINPTTTGFD